MKKFIFGVVAIISMHSSDAQSINKIISAKEVKRIEKILSSDDMQGRKTFTPGIEKASAFIEAEFQKIGLQVFNGAKNYRQEFNMYQSATVNSKITINGKVVADSLVVSFSYLPEISHHSPQYQPEHICYPTHYPAR